MRQSSARSAATPPNAATPASASGAPRGAAAIVAVDLDRAASAGGAARVAPALSMADRFRLDPAGNAAAVGMLLLIAAALALALSALAGVRPRLPVAPTWSIPVLALAGLAVAAYLAFVEVTGTPAVCGPVGDCNTVQQSQYARLFGVLPMGLLDVAGYAALLVAAAVGAIGPVPVRAVAPRAVWAMALLATVFSAYLTFLEPFVIGATCAWCLASAAIAALILVVATARLGPDRPWQGFRRFRAAGSPRT